MLYLITYDLRDPGRDYTVLGEAIKALSGDWQKPLENVWFVQIQDSSMSADAIYKELSEHLNKEKDRILIIEISKSGDKQGWLSRNFWKWLKEAR